MPKILVLHGPNLNLLGQREAERVHAAKSDETAYILINPAGYAHTSVALRDGLAAAAIPFIEVRGN
jgi:3-dehydroquinate dehydratase